MKSLIPLFLVALTIISGCDGSRKISTLPESDPLTLADNSRNSLDWDGVYRGILPCADCEGIQTEIRLNKDLSYNLNMKYLGKGNEVFNNEGTFKWNEQGSKITLEALSFPASTNAYLVGENNLFKLDADGNRIEGKLAEKYILAKNTMISIEDKYWKLIELQGNKIVKSDYQEKEAHFILDSKNRRISGNGGCNIFTGSYYKKEDNQLSFSPLATTRMVCFGVENENKIFKALDEVKSFSIDGDMLILYNAGEKEIAKFGYEYFK